MLGLKRGTVELLPHQLTWEETAKDTISLLNSLLGNVAMDIQHVGSTAVRSICAKPIIDIAVGVNTLDSIMPYIGMLEQNGIIFRKEDVKEQLLFVIGDFERDTRTHHIHVVKWNSIAWNNYINFRDYLNTFPEHAKEYEALRKELSFLSSGSMNQTHPAREPRAHSTRPPSTSRPRPLASRSKSWG